MGIAFDCTVHILCNVLIMHSKKGCYNPFLTAIDTKEYQEVISDPSLICPQGIRTNNLFPKLLVSVLS